MIDNKTVASLKAWFWEYVSRHGSSDPELQRNIDLKALHTKRVCDEIVDIATSIGLAEEKIRMVH